MRIIRICTVGLAVALSSLAWGDGEGVIVESGKALAEAIKDPAVYRIVLVEGTDFSSGGAGYLVSDREGEDPSRELLITGETPGKGAVPVVTEKIKVTRSNVVIQGIKFLDTNVEFSAAEEGSHGKLLRCYLENSTGDFTQPDMEVAYNELWNVRSIGFEFKFPDLKEAAWPVGDPRWKGGSDGAFRAHVHHNYFHDWIGKGNGHEAFRIGASNHHRLWEAEGLAEFNLIENVAVVGEGEAISIKTSCNVVRFNTLIKSQSISQRLGYGSHYYGNYIEDSHGMAIMDGRIINGEKRGNFVYANTLVNCWLGIHARAGHSNADHVDYIWNKANDLGNPEKNIPKIPIPESYQVDHPISGWNHVSRLSSRYAVIAGNFLVNSPIEIGRMDEGASIPAFETTIFCNQYLDTRINPDSISRLQYTFEDKSIPVDPDDEKTCVPAAFKDLNLNHRAFRLTRSQVGPMADL